MKKAALMMICAVMIAGCATGNNYQSDLDAMNAKITSLQNQLETKNREIASLQDQLRSLAAQLDLANRAKAEAEQRAASAEARLLQAMGKLAASGADSSSSSTKTVRNTAGIK